MEKKDSIELKSNAKVNVGLHIVGKRDDGYHLMETVYYPVKDLFDDILIEEIPGNACEVVMKGIEEEVPLEKNLCWKAWEMLVPHKKEGDSGVRISVQKRIPAGAGLGGGSSNAATVLVGLNKLWNLGIPDEELAEMGEKLGADVPFFVYNKPLYATGIGTVFEPIDLDLEAMGFRIELVLLPVHSSTPLAFKSLNWKEITQTAALKDLLAGPISKWAEHIRNDLETPVFKLHPEIEAAKASLYAKGAIYAAMSGSGSACFGIFRK